MHTKVAGEMEGLAGYLPDRRENWVIATTSNPKEDFFGKEWRHHINPHFTPVISLKSS